MSKVGGLSKPATCKTYIKLIGHVWFTTAWNLYVIKNEVKYPCFLTLKIDNFKLWAQLKVLGFSNTVTNRENCQNVTRHDKKNDNILHIIH